MPGEYFDALQELFSSTRVRRDESPHLVCRLQPGTPLAPVMELQPPPLCVITEADGATVFLAETGLAALRRVVPVVEFDGPWTVFRLTAPFDFQTTGYLAKVCGLLAKRGISVLSLATYRRDFILVNSARAGEAQEALDHLILTAPGHS